MKFACPGWDEAGKYIMHAIPYAQLAFLYFKVHGFKYGYNIFMWKNLLENNAKTEFGLNCCSVASKLYSNSLDVAPWRLSRAAWWLLNAPLPLVAKRTGLWDDAK